MVQVSRDGYVKRSSLRSYQAVDPEDNGLKPNDLAIFTGELSTLQHLYIVTNAGNIIYRPVYEISDARWKDTGEHLSQTVGLGTDEKVLAVFAFDQLDLAGTFVLGSSDGYIKQTALSDLQPQRTYKRKPMMVPWLPTLTSRPIKPRMFLLSADMRMDSTSHWLKFPRSVLGLLGSKVWISNRKMR